jgi:hypothetical protein
LVPSKSDHAVCCTRPCSLSLCDLSLVPPNRPGTALCQPVWCLSLCRLSGCSVFCVRGVGLGRAPVLCPLVVCLCIFVCVCQGLLQRAPFGKVCLPLQHRRCVTCSLFGFLLTLLSAGWSQVKAGCRSLYVCSRVKMCVCVCARVLCAFSVPFPPLDCGRQAVHRNAVAGRWLAGIFLRASGCGWSVRAALRRCGAPCRCCWRTLLHNPQGLG